MHEIPQVLYIASVHGVPGTAGLRVRDSVGIEFLLSNYHVVFGGGATIGDRVWAIRSEYDDGDQQAICLGQAHSGQIGRITFEGETYFVDCALVKLSDESEFPDWLQALMKATWSSEFVQADPGAHVLKYGARTGYTKGVLVDVAYPDHPIIDGRSWNAPGQLLVDSHDPELNFSAPGDSGAPLLDSNGRVLGLLWGSNASGQGIACPIEPVLDCLRVTLTSKH